MIWKVVVAGEGGQGVQALADTLALAAFRNNLNALYIPNFGIEQRGGVSLAMVQVSPGRIGSPKFLKADLVVALSGRALARTGKYCYQETIILYDSSLVEAPEVSDMVVGLQSYDTVAPEAFAEQTGYRSGNSTADLAGQKTFALPAADLAREKLHPRVFNMIILGAMVAVTTLVDLDLVKQALAEKLDRRFARDPQLQEHNFQALEMGYKLVKQDAAV